MRGGRLARRIVADSAGIPLLAVELLNAVAVGLDQRAVRCAWPQPLRTLQQTSPGDLPDAITAAVRVNFHRLSRDAQAVLLAAAVLDGRVPAALLGRAAGGGAEALAPALHELEWRRRVAPPPPGHWFSCPAPSADSGPGMCGAGAGPGGFPAARPS